MPDADLVYTAITDGLLTTLGPHLPWLIPLILAAALFKTPWFKGQLGEALVRLSARLQLPKTDYHGVHNVTLPTPDGTTQIDHLFVSRYGIFVVETKHMKGWIFGGERQARWTQKIYRSTHGFQNPLRQNYKHQKALEAALNLPADAIHSVVVFTGSATFKTKMPNNVTRWGGYIRYMKSFNEPVLTPAQVTAAIQQIETGRLAPTRQTRREHVQRLKTRADPQSERQCPKCGEAMAIRTARKGKYAGKRFWACTAYPQCKTVQSIHMPDSMNGV